MQGRFSGIGVADCDPCGATGWNACDVNGARTLRLGDAVLNDLAACFVEEWPAVAGRWLLAAGYDSQMLRDFAALSPEDGAALSGSMPEILASLGLNVPGGDQFWTHLAEVSGFTNRCRAAVAVVQQGPAPLLIKRPAHSPWRSFDTSRELGR